MRSPYLCSDDPDQVEQVLDSVGDGAELKASF